MDKNSLNCHSWLILLNNSATPFKSRYKKLFSFIFVSQTAVNPALDTIKKSYLPPALMNFDFLRRLSTTSTSTGLDDHFISPTRIALFLLLLVKISTSLLFLSHQLPMFSKLIR